MTTTRSYIKENGCKFTLSFNLKSYLFDTYLLVIIKFIAD